MADKKAQDHTTALFDNAISRGNQWRDLAVKQQARLARVEQLLEEADMIWPDPAEWAAEGVREFTERLRAALAGPAEPATTEGGE